MSKVKLNCWSDFCYILSFLYIVFLICGFFISFEAVVNFGKKEYSTELNLFTWIQVVNTDLEKWKLYVLLIAMMIIAILLDRFLVIPFLFKFSKEGKVMKWELAKRYQEMKEEKERLKNEKK